MKLRCNHVSTYGAMVMNFYRSLEKVEEKEKVNAN